MQVAEMKSAGDAADDGGDSAAAGRQQTRPAAAGPGAGAGMSMRFVGRRVVVKPGSSQIATADPSENENGDGMAKASVQISSRRSLAPSLRKRKQIAPVVNVADDAGDDEEEEDNGRAIQLKRQKAAMNRGEHNKRGQTRNQSEEDEEDDQRGNGRRQVRTNSREQRSVRFEHTTNDEERGEAGSMVEETSAPPATSGFGSLFTAKPMFSSSLQGKEAYSTLPIGLASRPSGKRDRKQLHRSYVLAAILFSHILEWLRSGCRHRCAVRGTLQRGRSGRPADGE
jgi:hypothetical protein